MPFEQSHVDAVTAAVNELATTKAAHDAAKDKLRQALPHLAPSMKEGDIVCLGPRVNAIQMINGEPKYVVIPSISDPQ